MRATSAFAFIREGKTLEHYQTTDNKPMIPPLRQRLCFLLRGSATSEAREVTVRDEGQPASDGAGPPHQPQPTRRISKLSKSLRVLGILLLALVGVMGILVVTYEYRTTGIRLTGSGHAYDDKWDAGYAWAEGTWAIDRPGHIAHVNTSDIFCIRDEMTCYEARGEIDNDFLFTHLLIHKIKKWDQSAIEYESAEDCPLQTFVIARITKQVSGLHRSNCENPRLDARNDVGLWAKAICHRGNARAEDMR